MRTWILLIASSLAACMSDAQVRARDTAQSANIAANLVYFEDVRTGLCFAGRWFQFNAAIMTNVPCTDQVRQLIATQPKAAQ